MRQNRRQCKGCGVRGHFEWYCLDCDWERDDLPSPEAWSTAVSTRQTAKSAGLSIEQHARIRTQTQYCEICGEEDDRTLHLDHCHTTNEFRGILCQKCNLGLGLFKDKPDILRKAAEYLESHGR